MSKKISNPTETNHKSIVLLILFVSLSILSAVLRNIFGHLWNGNLQTIFIILQVLFSLVYIWFGYKVVKSSIIIRKDKKLLKQFRDERVLEIDYKSRANGYLGCIVFASLFAVSAAVQKALFNNNFLFEVEGFYIALLVVAIGGIVTVFSAYSLDKE